MKSTFIYTLSGIHAVLLTSLDTSHGNARSRRSFQKLSSYALPPARNPKSNLLRPGGVAGPHPDCYINRASVRALNDEVVGDGKDSGHLPRGHVSELAVHLAGDDALKRDVSAVDDYMDRRVRPHRVAIESASVEDGPVRARANSIVHRRQRQDLDPVDHAVHAFDLRHAPLRVLASRRASHLPVERHRVTAAAHFISQVVEHAVKRQRHQVLANLSRQVRIAAPLLRARQSRRSRDGEEDRDRCKYIHYPFHLYCTSLIHSLHHFIRALVLLSCTRLFSRAAMRLRCPIEPIGCLCLVPSERRYHLAQSEHYHLPVPVAQVRERSAKYIGPALADSIDGPPAPRRQGDDHGAPIPVGLAALDQAFARQPVGQLRDRRSRYAQSRRQLPRAEGPLPQQP